MFTLEHSLSQQRLLYCVRWSMNKKMNDKCSLKYENIAHNFSSITMRVIHGIAADYGDGVWMDETERKQRQKSCCSRARESERVKKALVNNNTRDTIAYNNELCFIRHRRTVIIMLRATMKYMKRTTKLYRVYLR